ncbi:MAG: DivIVA domain-containing protein [Bacteroidales bacterium]|nr:DivIVA domain-containing protein [Clostridium sp.]MCM1204909.1 DivIVA domain-containing protein [Bacteroidales bacterium]
MLTPVDVQNKVFKGGIGFDKKDVETFMSELSSDYEQLYRSNVELKDKVTTLDESLQHYRSIEDSMQKALTLSEKTAEETINAANDKARQINTEAEKKAESILEDAKNELEETKNEIYRLQQQHAKFKKQFTYVLESQLKIMDGEMVDIDLGEDFQPSGYGEAGFGSFSGGGLGQDGLGTLGGGGGYVGSDGGHERTSQDPTFSHGTTLNMDPFADAANGGRFSRQTGGAYNGKSGNKSRPANKAASGKKDNKSSLNMKSPAKGDTKVKRNFASTAGNPTAEPAKAAPGGTVKEQQAAGQAQAAPKPQKAPVNAAPKAQPVQNVQPAQNAQPAQKAQPAQNAQPVQSAQPAQKAQPVQSAQPVHNAQPSTVQPEPIKVQLSVKPVTEKPKAQTSGTGAEQAAVKQTAVYPEESKKDDTVTQVSGEVEDKINEATMLDSEDNYTTGFDFVSEEDSDNQTAYANQNTSFSSDDEAAVTGEVEDKINEATMLDSEDNYTTGFDFVSEESEDTFSADSFTEEDSDTYSGEVEDKINEATMLDSEDNYSDGFDFVVGNEDNEEGIPTILQNSFSGQGGLGTQQGGLNIDPFGTGNDDVFEGDVEENPKPSNLIGNADDEEDGFNFL